MALVDELGIEFRTIKVFRPNRDVRFSADKSPYVEHYLDLERLARVQCRSQSEPAALWPRGAMTPLRHAHSRPRLLSNR